MVGFNPEMRMKTSPIFPVLVGVAFVLVTLAAGFAMSLFCPTALKAARPTRLRWLDFGAILVGGIGTGILQEVVNDWLGGTTEHGNGLREALVGGFVFGVSVGTVYAISWLVKKMRQYYQRH